MSLKTFRCKISSQSRQWAARHRMKTSNIKGKNELFLYFFYNKQWFTLIKIP